MTLREIRTKWPECFYGQSWFGGEEFLNAHADPAVRLPTEITPRPSVSPLDRLVNTATLAWLYVSNPESPIWLRYIWTSDADHHGQRVFVGDNGLGLEIHRHLAITNRWGIARW